MREFILDDSSPDARRACEIAVREAGADEKGPEDRYDAYFDDCVWPHIAEDLGLTETNPYLHDLAWKQFAWSLVRRLGAAGVDESVLETALSHRLGTDVRVSRKGDGPGEIEIHFKSPEDFDRICAIVGVYHP